MATSLSLAQARVDDDLMRDADRRDRWRATPHGVDRFATPLYTVAQAAFDVGVPTATFDAWARGYEPDPPGGVEVVGAPVVTSVPVGLGGATIPFIGLAEGFVLAAIRTAGVPFQRIRPAVNELTKQLGIDHVLASQAFRLHGAEILRAFAEWTWDTPEARSTRDLVVVRHGRSSFAASIEPCLRRVAYAPDGYADYIGLRAQARDGDRDPRAAA